MPNLSTTHCQGWSNPSNIFYGPVILSLSSYYSPAGSTSLVTIFGENFYSYSTVLFATYSPSVYFISSTTIQFYVPSSLAPGTYPVQVYNGSIGSNIVTYNLDNSSGYWLLNPDNSITNTNSGGITVNNNIILDGTYGNNYIQFPDNTQQFTAYNPLIGEIKMYAGLTLPSGYLWCDGSIQNIATYSNLFNVIGYTYGGAGLTFALPNLTQKFPIGSKDTTNMSVDYTDANGSPTIIGPNGGNQTMAANQLGQHTHNFTANATATTTIPNGNFVQAVGVNNANNTTVETVPTGARVVNVNVATQGFVDVPVTTNVSVAGVVENNIYTNAQESLLPPFTVIQYIICFQ